MRVESSQKARSQHQYSKMKNFVRDGEYLNYSSLRGIIAATADLWRIHETLDKQRAVLGTRYGASSEPEMIHDYQDVQYYESLVVDTPSDEMNVLYDTGSSNLWVPNSDDYGGTQVTVSTTIADQTPTSPTTAHSESSTVRVQVRLLLRRPCE